MRMARILTTVRYLCVREVQHEKFHKRYREIR